MLSVVSNLFNINVAIFTEVEKQSSHSVAESMAPQLSGLGLVV